MFFLTPGEYLAMVAFLDVPPVMSRINIMLTVGAGALSLNAFVGFLTLVVDALTDPNFCHEKAGLEP